MWRPSVSRGVEMYSDSNSELLWTPFLFRSTDSTETLPNKTQSRLWFGLASLGHAKPAECDEVLVIRCQPPWNYTYKSQISGKFSVIDWAFVLTPDKPHGSSFRKGRRPSFLWCFGATKGLKMNWRRAVSSEFNPLFDGVSIRLLWHCHYDDMVPVMNIKESYWIFYCSH